MKDLPLRKPSPNDELVARVAILEREVQRLSRLLDMRGSSTPLPTPAPPVGLLSASGGHSRRPGLQESFRTYTAEVPYGVPAGSRLMRAVAEAHGASPMTAARQVKEGKLQAFTRQRPNRPEHTETWLTPEQIAPAVRVWRESGNAFHPCPDCPHE